LQHNRLFAKIQSDLTLATALLASLGMVEIVWTLMNVLLAFPIAVHRIQMLFASTPLAHTNASANPDMAVQ